MVAPRFSVLLPTHARPDVLGLAIQSVLDQTEPDFELLVVGDGVKDDTRTVVAGFTDPRIRFFDLPKAEGFGYANRNLALREAQAPLFAYAADDDLMMPDALARMGAVLDQPDVLAVYSEALWVSADGIGAPDVTNLAHPAEFHRFMKVQNSVPAGVYSYRRETFEGTDHWPLMFGAGDWAMWKAAIRRHGLGRFRSIRDILLIHFTATRTGRRDARFPRLRAWLKLADRGEHWPAALKLPIPEGEPPQLAYARALRDDPDWLPAMRAGARDLIDHLALDALARIELYDRPRHIVRRLLGRA